MQPTRKYQCVGWEKFIKMVEVVVEDTSLVAEAVLFRDAESLEEN